MATIKKNWVLILILIIAIYLLYKYLNKNKAITGPDKTTTTNNIFSANPFSPVITAVVPIESNTSTNANTGTNSSNISTTGYIIGDKLYAKGPVSAYFDTRGALGGQDNVAYVFKNGDLVGTYLNTDGNFIKVLINTGIFSGYYPYYVLSSDLYNK